MTSDPLPSLFRDEPFLLRDALSEVGRARLRRKDLAVPARGLRVSRPLLRRPRPELLAPLLGPDHHFSHVTAAAIWGLPVPHSECVHVSTRGNGPVMRRAGVVGHRVSRDRASVTLERGLPVSQPAAAWAECAALLTHEQLVVVGDHLVWPDRGLTHSELECTVRAWRGRRGVVALKRALADVRVGSQSPRETRLRLRLTGDGFRTPLLNCEIHDAQGRFIARPDLIFGRERVCVEYDGDHHRTDRRTYRNDKRRREALVDAGWHALYVSDDDLQGAYWIEFVGRLRRALARGEEVAAFGVRDEAASA